MFRKSQDERETYKFYDKPETVKIKWHISCIDELHNALDLCDIQHTEPVKPSDSHSVLHHFPIKEPTTQPPKPWKSETKWDKFHVRLPCTTPSGTDNRWSIIETSLLQPIENISDLRAAILTYNKQFRNEWDFRTLHDLFQRVLSPKETDLFFKDLLPRMIRLALRLPDLIRAPIPLLRQEESRCITLTQQQISCLLANAFFCTYTERHRFGQFSEYSNFPDINFNSLFHCSGSHVFEKLKCLLNYFHRVCPAYDTDDSCNVPTGCVTFERRFVRPCDLPNWSQSRESLAKMSLHIRTQGTIEDQGAGMLQVDFANKLVGGGVLGAGCVQEEIRFVICPELIVARLFTESLNDTEALVIAGCERYSDYDGYGQTFSWSGNHEDCTLRDSSRRRKTHIVAIDALPLHPIGFPDQCLRDLMLREMNKAYVGFLYTLATSRAPAVATGNWGCGAFGGDVKLKALLQILACAVTHRPMVYFTHGNDNLRDELYRMYTVLRDQNILVKELWAILAKFHDSQSVTKEALYPFVYGELEKLKVAGFFRFVRSLYNISIYFFAAETK